MRSHQGTRVLADHAYDELTARDILLVPGGMGIRPLVEDAAFLARIARAGRGAALVASVCTGSAVLAAAGLLAGCRATSNKRAFTWANSFGEGID